MTKPSHGPNDAFSHAGYERVSLSSWIGRRTPTGLCSVLLVALAACGDAPKAGSEGKLDATDTRESKPIDAVFPCTSDGVLAAVEEGGGPHSFACKGPTTVFTDQTIVVDRDVILDGLNELVLDGGNAHLVLSVQEGVAAELRRLEVRGGKSDLLAGGIDNRGSLTIDQARVSGNVGEDVGGIWNAESGSLTLRNSEVSENQGDYAGGILNLGEIAMSGSQIAHNIGSTGGVDNYGTLVVSEGSISNNEGYDIGALFNQREATALLVGVDVADNRGDAIGGIFNLEAALAFMDGDLTRNVGYLVGGIWNDDGGRVTIFDATLSENVARGVGGIRNDDRGHVALTSSMVIDHAGTGLDNRGDGVLSLKGSLITVACRGTITSEGNNMMQSRDIGCGFDEKKGDATRERFTD